MIFYEYLELFVLDKERESGAKVNVSNIRTIRDFFKVSETDVEKLRALMFFADRSRHSYYKMSIDLESFYITFASYKSFYVNIAKLADLSDTIIPDFIENNLELLLSDYVEYEDKKENCKNLIRKILKDNSPNDVWVRDLVKDCNQSYSLGIIRDALYEVIYDDYFITEKKN